MRIRETINLKVGERTATIRTRDRHTIYEPRASGRFCAVEFQTVRLFDEAGAFLRETTERAEQEVYRVARPDETARMLVVPRPGAGPIGLVVADAFA